MAQKMFHNYPVGVDSILELIAFFHQPILQRVLDSMLQSGSIPVSPIMLLEFFIVEIKLEKITTCTIFFYQPQNRLNTNFV